MLKAGAIVAGFLLLVAGSAIAGNEKMTICHQTDDGEHTIHVSRSAWGAHERHGDHEGACGDARLSSDPGHEGEGRSEPPADLSLTIRGEGEVDGDAVFWIHFENHAAVARDVKIHAGLEGEGTWTVRTRGLDCGIAHGVLDCDLGDLAPGTSQTFRLEFDGRGPCEEPSVDAIITARNADHTSDDQARVEVEAGACAAVGPPSPP